MLKKVLCILLAVIMVTAFIACTPKKAEEPKEDDKLNWPTETVTITLPVSAGGGNDLFCRVMADFLNKKTGGNFIVVNDTSGGGLAAYEIVRNAKPDGYNFLCYNTSAQVRQYTGMYNHDLATEFAIVGPTYSSTAGYVVAARGDLPYKTWDEFVEYAKANPGKVRKGVENRGVPHLQSMLLEDACGYTTKMMETTGGDPDKLAALLGNIVDIAVMSANQVTAYVESGEINVLLVCSLEKSEKFPNSTYMGEVGLGDIYIETYGFMAAPKETDPKIVKYLNELIGEMENDPDCVEAFKKMNYYYKHLTVEEFRAKFENSAKLIKDACRLIK